MSIREAKFEYNAIKETLEEQSEELTMAEQLNMQYRMCELMLEIRKIRKNQAKEAAESFRKTKVHHTKRVKAPYMTDYRAFKHFLENPENANRYNKNTLYSWKSKLKAGKTPAALEKILKFAGYTIKYERKWNKPKKRR